MSKADSPSDGEIQGFLDALKQYRDTLTEAHQKLLDAMVAAAMGTPEKKEEEEVSAYWVAAHNPVGLAGGVGHGTVVATPYGPPGLPRRPGGQRTPRSIDANTRH